VTIWRGLAAAAFLAAAPAVAQDRTETVAGWTVADVGGKPGDDVERTLTASRALRDVRLSYDPGQSGSGASYVLKFEACGGFTFSTGFQYDDPPATHLQNARAEIAESYADFAKRCKAKFTPEAELMQGFGEALATAEKWLADRPFVYPPDEPATSGSSQ
jgi:hypothetical protein